MRSGGRGEMRFPFFLALCGRVDLEQRDCKRIEGALLMHCVSPLSPRSHDFGLGKRRE